MLSRITSTQTLVDDFESELDRYATIAQDHDKLRLTLALNHAINTTNDVIRRLLRESEITKPGTLKSVYYKMAEDRLLLGLKSMIPEQKTDFRRYALQIVKALQKLQFPLSTEISAAKAMDDLEILNDTTQEFKFLLQFLEIQMMDLINSSRNETEDESTS